MSDQAQETPRAPQPAVQPAPVSTTAVPQADSVQPTATPLAPTTEEPQTLNSRLNAADRYWKFKGVLRIVAIILGFIGIGTIGWCMSTTPRNAYYFNYGYDEILWPCLVTFVVSIVWCTACLLVLVIRKKPIHPGARVGVDLVLWLGFIATALFGLAALLQLITWGDYGGDLGGWYSSGGGDYTLAENGTWVWEGNSNSAYYGERACNRTRSSYSDGYPYAFKNCSEQDAFINQLWQEKPHRQSVQTTGVVCQFMVLILHLTLFIWACVDTHRYRRSKVSKDAEKIAAGIVQTMISNGTVVRPPGNAWGQQPMGYYPMPMQQQPYPMYQQGMAPAHSGQQIMSGGANGPVAGPSNEKSEGPRYA